MMPKTYTFNLLLLYVFLFVDMTSLYPSSRSPNCIFFLSHIVYILIKFLNDPCKTWVKISKVMPHPKSIFPGKGRDALWQKVQIFHLKYGTAQSYILFASKFMVRLNRTYYLLLKFTGKIFKIVSSVEIYSESRKIHSIHPKYSAPFINTLCFRYLPRQEKFSQIPANYANSAQFTHIICEPREICTIC